MSTGTVHVISGRILAGDSFSFVFVLPCKLSFFFNEYIYILMDLIPPRHIKYQAAKSRVQQTIQKIINFFRILVILKHINLIVPQLLLRV